MSKKAGFRNFVARPICLMWITYCLLRRKQRSPTSKRHIPNPLTFSLTEKKPRPARPILHCHLHSCHSETKTRILLESRPSGYCTCRETPDKQRKQRGVLCFMRAEFENEAIRERTSGRHTDQQLRLRCDAMLLRGCRCCAAAKLPSQDEIERTNKARKGGTMRCLCRRYPSGLGLAWRWDDQQQQPLLDFLVPKINASQVKRTLVLASRMGGRRSTAVVH